jgi:16S rRNA C1402 (ribose-2'-O) methylase RsmI
MNIAVTPLPGASSLMAALSVCPFDLEEFLFI